MTSDKLPAISGVAHQLQSILGNAYIAGLWEDDLIRSLIWAAMRSTRRTQSYCAPSWSWTSMDGGIRFEVRTSSDQKHCQIVDASVSVSGVDRMGAVTAGHLRLVGRIARAFSMTAPDAKAVDANKVILVPDNCLVAEGFLDHTDAGRNAQLYILLLRSGSDICSPPDQWKRKGYGIVLEEVRNGEYRRIGAFSPYLPSGNIGGPDDPFKGCEDQELTII